jgi:hypothetical protein
VAKSKIKNPQPTEIGPDEPHETASAVARRADYGVDRQTFVWAWEGSESTDEVYEKLAAFAAERNLPVMPRPVMYARANELRRNGVELRKFKPGRKPAGMDAQKLNEYAEAVRRQARAGKAAPPPPVEKVARPPAPNETSVISGVHSLLGGAGPAFTPQQVDQIAEADIRKLGLK